MSTNYLRPQVGDPIISSDDFVLGLVISTGKGPRGETLKLTKRYKDGGWGWVKLRKNGTWPKGPKKFDPTWLEHHFPRHGYDVIADPTLGTGSAAERASMAALRTDLAQPPKPTGYGELRSPVFRANMRTAGHDRARKKIGGRTRPGGKPWLAGTMAERIAIRAGVDFDLLSDGRGGFASLSLRDFEKIVDALGGE